MIVFQTIDVQGRGVSFSPFSQLVYLDLGKRCLEKKAPNLLANSSFSKEKKLSNFRGVDLPENMERMFHTRLLTKSWINDVRVVIVLMKNRATKSRANVGNPVILYLEHLGDWYVSVLQLLFSYCCLALWMMRRKRFRRNFSQGSHLTTYRFWPGILIWSNHQRLAGKPGTAVAGKIQFPWICLRWFLITYDCIFYIPKKSDMASLSFVIFSGV